MVTNMEVRQSMLDVVKNGLQTSGRTTYLHRMVYIGGHKSGRNALEEFMKDLMTAQAEQQRDEVLTGFLLVYSSHFIHIVEGSESALTRHLRSVVDSESEEARQIGAAKVICEIAHINKRCLSGWTYRTASPPTLAEQPKTDVSVTDVARHVDSVLSKVLRLVDAVKKLSPSSQLSQQLSLQLPEPEVLQLLLASPLIRDVRVLLREHDVPPRITLYDDVVWPVQSDFVPYNLLEEVGEIRRHAAPGEKGGGGGGGLREEEQDQAQSADVVGVISALSSMRQDL